MKIQTIFLERVYKATLPIKSHGEEANFSYHLELQHNRFHMRLGDWDSFINNTIDVCNWPVEEWTMDQVRECVRIFEEEYIPCCGSTSEIVDDQFLVSTAVFCVNEEYNDSERITCTDDVVATLWSIISDPSNEWVTDNHTETLMVRDSIPDIGYVEDPFPFDGSSCEFYREFLPTMMAFAKK